MSFLTENTEKRNNYAFSILFILYLICFVIQSGAMLFFLFAGAFLYGIFTKNKLKTVLFGFLIPMVFSFYAFFFVSTAEFFRILPFYSLLSLLASLSGFFAAASPSDEITKKLFCFISIILAVVMGIIFFTGIN